MSSLRFLLVYRSPAQCEQISALLMRANHSVLPTSGLAEAADALTVEQFDAVLMDAEFRTRGLQEFSARLRSMQPGLRGAPRVPLIGLSHALSHSLSNGDMNGNSDNGDYFLDAVMPDPIDPETLTQTVLKLSEAVFRSKNGAGHGDLPLSVFEPEKFKEQVGFDNDLMIEIIDLFLHERERQELEMREALLSGNFDLLMRLAHTIKGSLGTLHAMQARERAQELEDAAKDREEDVCRQSLAALEGDLLGLEPQLMSLRAS